MDSEMPDGPGTGLSLIGFAVAFIVGAYADLAIDATPECADSEFSRPFAALLRARRGRLAALRSRSGTPGRDDP
ncbi:MAG: hypothetical protein ACYC2Z_06110 [Candidatus Nanopelagicales bacterium]